MFLLLYIKNGCVSQSIYCFDLFVSVDLNFPLQLLFLLLFSMLDRSAVLIPSPSTHSRRYSHSHRFSPRFTYKHSQERWVNTFNTLESHHVCWQQVSYFWHLFEPRLPFFRICLLVISVFVCASTAQYVALRKGLLRQDHWLLEPRLPFFRICLLVILTFVCLSTAQYVV